MPRGKGKKVIIKDRKGEKKVMYVCPFPYSRINPTTGTKHTDYNFSDARPDQNNEARLCPVGKGSHCRQCPHYAQHKISEKKWSWIYENIKKTGQAPMMWKHTNPGKVVDPMLGAKLIKPKTQRLTAGGI